MNIMDVLLDNVFALTLLFIFASAILGAFLSARARDKCLKDFHRYSVTLEDKTGNIAWGCLRVFSTGFELEYETEYQNTDSHVESSYVVYENEYINIYTLYRYHDQLTSRDKRRRLRQIKRTYRPSLLWRLGRKIRNAFNTLRDAFTKSIDAFIGQAKKGSTLLAAQGGKVSEMGKGVISHVGNAYDPILERFVGKQVVVEITRDGKTQEYPGILKEYTSKFLELLAVRLPGPAMIPLDGKTSPVPDIEVKREGLKVVLKNLSAEAVTIVRVVGKDYEQQIDSLLSPDAEVDFTLDQEQISEPKLILQMPRDFDMIVPRAHGLVRHAGKRDKVDWKTYFLGAGTAVEKNH
ncbi:MAG: hypothetical protein E3J72_17875 [Planctomycetota bacterium]|nr:MAG: hypothetical protein E3J72_17875 [Planctomycetota bacterium]